MKTILVVAAHADDEALGCGGTIARHVAEQDKVHLVFMTNGVGARNSEDQDIIHRKNQAKKAAALLGVESVTFFDFPDNQMGNFPLLSVTQSIEEVVQKIKPSIIYTHHFGDLNIDHRITQQAVLTACRPQPEFPVKTIYSFEVLSSTEWQMPGPLHFSPNVYVNITDYFDKKMAVLQLYHAEMRVSPHSRSFENMRHLAAFRGHCVGVEYAEAFTLIRQII
ncbi:MAG: PIG-L family deacetylase [Pseudomonadota bacterium]